MVNLKIALRSLWMGLVLLLTGCSAAGGPQSILPSVGDYATTEGFRGSSSSLFGGRSSLLNRARRDPANGPRGIVQGKVFVRSAKGAAQPLEGAEVVVQVPYHPDDALFFQTQGVVKDSPNPLPVAPYQWYTAKTDQDGSYIVKSVPAGQYPVSASKVGYSVEEKLVVVGFGQTVTRDFTLRLESGTVSGTVVDADTGSPIERATVQVIVPVPLDAATRALMLTRPERTPQTQTDEKGQFTLPVPKGQQTLVAFKEDYESQQNKVKIAIGGSATVDFKLRAKALMTAQITTDKRQYAPGESVRMTLTLMNAGKRPVTLHFRSGQIFDFIVKRGRVEVWRWSQDKAFTQALQDITLAPGETKRFEVTWDQVD
ncbi:MAG: BsuPI-related putative proteinase inhibitor, partial [Abditibacteriales bacterium]|nr:BsuPI-related putative proteinase inhibitor [Abditibacteriales bacterium]MDW8367868.1 BsuPI-related putative proteinase inhibitor [Abditibacteriales bacterium]